MDITLTIPDDLATRLGADVARRALEGLSLEEYRAGRLTESELRRILGFSTRYELDGFLKQRGVFHDYGPDDLEQERAALDRLDP